MILMFGYGWEPLAWTATWQALTYAQCHGSCWLSSETDFHPPVSSHLLFPPLECSSLPLLSTWGKIYPLTSRANVTFLWILPFFPGRVSCVSLCQKPDTCSNQTAPLSGDSRRESPCLQQPPVCPSWANSKNALVPFAPDKEIQLPIFRIALPNTKNAFIWVLLYLVNCTACENPLQTSGRRPSRGKAGTSNDGNM